jgi:transcriptional regulator with XRE-family HTH domain
MTATTAAPTRDRSPPVHLSPQETAALAVGRTIKVLRTRRLLSQEALGQRADTHRNYVGAIERGEGNPTLASVVRLVLALGFPLREVFDAFAVCHREVRRDARAGRLGVVGKAACR